MPALSSVPMLICLSSPLLACLANSWSSVWLKPGLLILTPRGLSLTSFSESWAKYQHHLLFSPVNSAFLAYCFFYGHTQGNSRSCRILLTYSEIQHLLSHWEFKPSPASLHLVSQLLSFASSLTNLTFIFKIHRDCQDCCLSLFFWSCHTSLCIPGLNLPSLFYQPIAELFFFSGSSWLLLLFISFPGVSPYYQLSPFIYSVFIINYFRPLATLPIIFWRNSLHKSMQYPLNFSLKHSHATNLF